MQYDILIKSARYFDGTADSDGSVRDIAIKDGKIAKVSQSPILQEAKEVIDADGKWVMPGFIDVHTHYDAEVMINPALDESLRHGVTTVFLGGCSLSMIYSDPDDCSDLFTRVEGFPREIILPVLQKEKTWKTPKEYISYLSGIGLGPNVSFFVGHSDIRVAGLGFERAVDASAELTAAETRKMTDMLKESLDAGALGMSFMMSKGDKIDGTRFRSLPLPSTFAKNPEYAAFNTVLREYGRVHQGAPNIYSPLKSMSWLFGQSMGLFRKNLKMTLIVLADVVGVPAAHMFSRFGARMANLFSGNFRWQFLPSVFTLYVDGMNFVNVEELPSGLDVIHEMSKKNRQKMVMEPLYRARFKEEIKQKAGPVTLWNRQFGDMIVVQCEDKSLEGKSFLQIANETGKHPVDAFLDLMGQYGEDIRWRQTVANQRPDVLKKLCNSSSSQIGFSDAGAHLRNICFYNLPLRMLKMVNDAQSDAKPFMSVGKAVWKLTGELADWFNIDAGRIREGDRADLIIVDPAKLDDRIYEYHEADFKGVSRIVNRNDETVPAVILNGKMAARNGQVESNVGQSCEFGRFLPVKG